MKKYRSRTELEQEELSDGRLLTTVSKLNHDGTEDVQTSINHKVRLRLDVDKGSEIIL